MSKNDNANSLCQLLCADDLTVTQQGRLYCPPATDKETEHQRVEDKLA